MTKTFLVTASDIQWDTWGKTVDIKLPRSVKAVVEAESEVECEEGESVPEALSRMLTEEYGFCHEGYDIDSCEPYEGDDSGIIEEYGLF